LKDASNYHKIYGSGKRMFYMPEDFVEKIKSHLWGNVLDIGIADGEKLKFLIEGCDTKEVVGIEPDSILVQKARELFESKKNVRVINEHFENFNREREYFNTILMLEVIEHLPYSLVREVLAKIKDLLADKGTVIMSTPNKYVYSALCAFGFEQREPTHINEMHCGKFRSIMKEYFKEKYFIGVLPGMSITRKFPKIYPIFSKINRLVAHPLISRAVYFIGNK